MLQAFHRITESEYPELEGTYKESTISKCWYKQQHHTIPNPCVRAVPKHSLSSGRLGCAHRPLGTAFPQPPPLLWKQLVQCYMNSKLFLFPLNTPTIAHHNQECFLFFLYKIKKSNLSSNSINEIIWVKPKASVASQKETQCQQHGGMHICISKSI